MFLLSDNGTISVGLRGVHETGHDRPGMGRRSKNLASLLGNVRFDICVDRGDCRTVPVVLRGLPGNHAASVSREYPCGHYSIFCYVIFVLRFLRTTTKTVAPTTTEAARRVMLRLRFDSVSDTDQYKITNRR